MTPKLQQAFDECARHIHYLQSARSRMPSPVTAEHFAAASEAFVAALDQFVFRFVKLQDALGQRVLRGVLTEVLKEPYDDTPFRDVLDRLEKLGVIDSADRWDEYRIMRNILTHEYPQDPAIKAANVELALQIADELDGLVARLPKS